MSTLDIVTTLGTGAFAVSGALLAARHRMDLIGFLFVANITGVGGGTVRDLLLGVPVFWVSNPLLVLVCSGAAVLTYLAASVLVRAERALLWADAVGLALFGVLGAQKALLLDAAAPVAIVMGVFSACLGGIIRDVTLNDPPILMSREIYVTAALTGSLVYVAAARWLGPLDWVAMAAGTLVGFGVRACAIAFDISLPAHRGIRG